MNEFEKIFNDLTKKESPHFLWVNWMDWVIDANLIAIKDRGLDFHGHEQEYYDLYKAWVELTNQKLSSGEYWYDYLGEFFEDHLITKFNKKNDNQFFTPSDVCKLMNTLCLDDKNMPHDTFYDCACGSGRLLLDAHRHNPQGIMIGWDYDKIASRMAVLNFYLHGIRGSILRMNSLTGEFFEAWRVNNYIGYGLPVPHIELVSESEAYRFIGRNVESGAKETKIIPEPATPEKSKQVTLECFS